MPMQNTESLHILILFTFSQDLLHIFENNTTKWYMV